MLFEYVPSSCERNSLDIRSNGSNSSHGNYTGFIKFRNYWINLMRKSRVRIASQTHASDNAHACSHSHHYHDHSNDLCMRIPSFFLSELWMHSLLKLLLVLAHGAQLHSNNDRVITGSSSISYWQYNNGLILIFEHGTWTWGKTGRSRFFHSHFRLNMKIKLIGLCKRDHLHVLECICVSALDDD